MKCVEVSIIYVNYNSLYNLLKSVESVREKTENVSYEIIVVDNNSDEDIASLQKIVDKVIMNNENYGFAKACNIGASHAAGEYLLFLNPDTVLKGNSVKILKDFLSEKNDVGAVGCLTIEGDRGNLPGGARKFHTIFTEILERFNISDRIFKNPYYFRWNFDTTREVDALIGACIMIRKTVFDEINGFDEKFFLYYEDVDLCKRVWNAGYKIYFLSECTIFHKGGESITKSIPELEKIFYINLESASYYFRKHFGKLYANLWFKIISLLYFIKYLITKKSLYLKLAKWRPIFD